MADDHSTPSRQWEAAPIPDPPLQFILQELSTSPDVHRVLYPLPKTGTRISWTTCYPRKYSEPSSCIFDPSMRASRRTEPSLNGHHDSTFPRNLALPIPPSSKRSTISHTLHNLEVKVLRFIATPHLKVQCYHLDAFLSQSRCDWCALPFLVIRGCSSVAGARQTCCPDENL